MDVQPHLPYSDDRSAFPDTRRQAGQCLPLAFAVGSTGTFTSLLEAIGDDTGYCGNPGIGC